MMRLGALLVVLLTVGCSTEPELEFADWLLPVPEGIPIHEYAPVPLEGRDPEAVQLIEDLVIGTDLTAREAIVYEPSAVVATDDGTIFVADQSVPDVKVFGPDGTYWKTLGGAGQGPGEFARIGAMMVAGDSLVIHDSRNRRLSAWTLDGEHVADHTLISRSNVAEWRGFADGTLAVLAMVGDDDDGRRLAVDHWSSEGEEISRVFDGDFPAVGIPLDLDNPAGFAQQVVDTFDDPRLMFDVADQEIVLVSPALEYQLLAMTPQAEPVWALRVAWDQQPYPEDQRQPFLDGLFEGLPIENPPTADALTWSEQTVALSEINTDGAGRIYVFPGSSFFFGPDDPDENPVDVYSPAGEFITAGVIPSRWSFAAGNHVYGIRSNELDELEVVRYRIVINDR